MKQELILILTLTFAAGAALGAFFYGGLWWTLGRLQRRNAHLLVFASFIIRTGLTVAGIWFVTEGRWERVIAVMAGFLLVRFILTRKLGPHALTMPHTQGGQHGS